MKLDVSDYFDDKTLVILDIDSIANKDFVSSYLGNKGGKPYFSFKYKNKNYNSTILYPMLSRLVNADFYIEDVDFLISFDTKPNFLKWINELSIDKCFEQSSEYFSQLLALRKSFKDMNLTVLEKDGMESYSMIFKAVKDNYESYDKIIIYTRDKVLYSLVDDKVSLVLPSSKYDLTINNFKINNGVQPNLIDYKHIFLGDSTLNLKGVTGVGNAKFEKLLLEFDNNKDIHQNISDSKLLTKLQQDMAHSIYDWILPSKVQELNTYPNKMNKGILKQYIELYECKSLLDKIL